MSLSIPGGHPNDVPLTDEEKRAIATLQRLAKRWPRSLWLFATGNNVHVMRCGADGRQVQLGRCGGTDPAYEVAAVNIPNDGGDW